MKSLQPISWQLSCIREQLLLKISKALDVLKYEEPSLKRYAKPYSRPEPRGLDSLSAFGVKRGDTYMRSVLIDLFWQLTGMAIGETSSVSTWSGVNSVQCETNFQCGTAYQVLSKEVTAGNALRGLRNANVLES